MRAYGIQALRWLPAAVWAMVIYSVSAVSGSNLPGGPAWLAHFGEYAILGSLVAWAIGGSREARWRIIVTIALCSLYGASDEFHQSFVPSRTPDVVDWMVDTAGASTGALLTLWASRVLDRTS